MSGNSLIDFRIAYLRLIARAWVSSKYIEEIVRYSPGKLRGHLKEEYQYDWCWPAMDFVLEKAGAEWQPRRTGGWHGRGFSGQLTVKLPLDKGCICVDNPELMLPIALSDFYALRPSIFGRVLAGLDDPCQALSSGIVGQPYPLSQGNEADFPEFGAVMLRALGLAWKEGLHSEFTQKLQDPHSCLPALAGWLGYTSPWNMNIVVENDRDAAWVPPQAGAPGNNGWLSSPAPTSQNSGPPAACEDPDNGKQKGTTLSKNKLLLHIPQRPEECDLTLFPVALAAYNLTGPAYPFTCCP